MYRIRNDNLVRLIQVSLTVKSSSNILLVDVPNLFFRLFALKRIVGYSPTCNYVDVIWLVLYSSHVDPIRRCCIRFSDGRNTPSTDKHENKQGYSRLASDAANWWGGLNI